MLSRVRLSAASSLGLVTCFADLDALVPRVTDFGVTDTSAVSEPRTSATTTTVFARFIDGAAFEACGSDACRRGGDCCWHLYVDIRKTKNE